MLQEWFLDVYECFDMFSTITIVEVSFTILEVEFHKEKKVFLVGETCCWH